MPSTFEQLNPTRVKFTVEIPSADLSPAIKKAYRGISEQINVPGFRKGKVPPAVIDQRFGREVVIEEAINETIPNAYHQAVTEAKVTTLGQPEIEVTKRDEDAVEFTAEVDVRPEFDLPDLDTISVEVDAVTVSDSDIDERIEMLRQRFATNTTVERPAAEGDLVVISMVGRRDGVELADASVSDITYKVGDKGMVDGLDEAVIGMSAGESKVFSSKLVGGVSRGEDADIEVTVTRVQEQKLPEVDDDFAQLVSEFDTVAEMRDDLKGGIERQNKYLQLSKAKDRVLEEILKVVEFPLPEAIVAEELEGRKAQINSQLSQAGLTIEQYLEDTEDETATNEEEFWADIEKRTVDALRAQLVLDKHADETEVNVDQNDLVQLLFRKAQQNGTSPEQEAQHMQEHGHMAEWMGEIRRGKALEAIMKAVTVVDTEGNKVSYLEAAETEEADQA